MNAWLIATAGTLCCIGGLLLFQRNVYEEGRSVKRPILIMLVGLVLIGIGTAKYFKLI